MQAEPYATPVAASSGVAVAAVASADTTWLLFALGATEYAVAVESVQQIIGLLPITRVPRMPEPVRGVINLRGRVIPVVDLRIRFSLEAVDHGQRTCIIVVRAAGAELGIVVDRVMEVAHIPASSIEDAPRFGGSDTNYLVGVAKHGARVVLLLDIEQTLADGAIDAFDAAATVQPA